jgi:hypothetical protein
MPARRATPGRGAARRILRDVSNPVPPAPQVTNRNDFLHQVAAMGWRVEVMPSRRHFKITKAGSTIITPDLARHAQTTLGLLRDVDSFRKRVRRT